VAETNLIGATSTDTQTHDTKGVHGPFWINNKVGAFVAHESGDVVGFYRTTDGDQGASATWTRIAAYSGKIETLDAWFDQQTPGNTGTKLHCCSIDSTNNLVKYYSLDINDGTASTPVTVFTITTAIGSSSHSTSIVRARSGLLYCTGRADTTGSDMRSSDDGGLTWSATLADPHDAVPTVDDYVELFPANTGDDDDIAAIHVDASGLAVTGKMYDASLDTWTETATIINMLEVHASFRKGQVDAVYDLGLDGIVIAAVTRIDHVTADLEVATMIPDSIATPTIANRTNVKTDTVEMGHCRLFTTPGGGDLYCFYAIGATNWTVDHEILHKISADNGDTWGSEQANIVDSPDDIHPVSLGAVSPTNGGRLLPIWNNDDLLKVHANAPNFDLEIAGATVEAAGRSAARKMGHRRARR
jgi:hypothetical protein